MKKLLILNASPKKRKSQSERFTAELLRHLDEGSYDIDKVYLYELNYSKYLFEQIATSDTVILATPLYIDCLPAKVLELFEDMEQFTKETFYETKPACYLIINCGFMEASQNNTAIEIVGRFCQRVGYRLRQAVSIGSGAMILETRQKSLVERAMCQLARTIEGREPLAEVISLNVKMPKFLFMSRSNNLWIQVGKKRGLTKGELKEGYYKAP